jgi:hypothetical protein
MLSSQCPFATALRTFLDNDAHMIRNLDPGPHFETDTTIDLGGMGIASAFLVSR